MLRRDVIMLSFMLIAARGAHGAPAVGSNLRLRVGEAAYVIGGSAATPFIRLYVENDTLQVVFINLLLASKSVLILDGGGDLGKSTSRVRDADHGAKLCNSVDDIVAIEPGRNIVVLAALPDSVSAGRISVLARMQIATSSIPDLCAAWPRKMLEARGTVTVPGRPAPSR